MQLWGPIPTPPTHRLLTPSTWLEFGVSPPKKFEIANAIGEFPRRKQIKTFGGEIWGQSRNLWREVPENWGRSPNRDREGKRSGEGVQRATPQKICENLNLKPCRLSGAQFKQHSISFLAFIICSLISLFFFSMRDVIVVKPPKATIYQGAECRGVVLGSSSHKTLCKFQD